MTFIACALSKFIRRRFFKKDTDIKNQLTGVVCNEDIALRLQ